MEVESNETRDTRRWRYALTQRRANPPGQRQRRVQLGPLE
jgi:hypothetical protein